jgi:hypothetical protein
MMKARLHGGDEWDAFSRRARRLLRWRPGAIKEIKRRFWKRERKAAVRDMCKQLSR